MNAHERRLAGIQAVNDRVVSVDWTEEGQPFNVWHMTDNAEVAALIRTLAPLGRTQRWQDAIETWAATVELNVNAEGGSFEWAFFQYSIYAGYAA